MTRGGRLRGKDLLEVSVLFVLIGGCELALGRGVSLGLDPSLAVELDRALGFSLAFDILESLELSGFESSF